MFLSCQNKKTKTKTLQRIENFNDNKTDYISIWFHRFRWKNISKKMECWTLESEMKSEKERKRTNVLHSCIHPSMHMYANGIYSMYTFCCFFCLSYWTFSFNRIYPVSAECPLPILRSISWAYTFHIISTPLSNCYCCCFLSARFFNGRIKNNIYWKTKLWILIENYQQTKSNGLPNVLNSTCACNKIPIWDNRKRGYIVITLSDNSQYIS